MTTIQTILSNTVIHIICGKFYPYLHKTKFNKSIFCDIWSKVKNLFVGKGVFIGPNVVIRDSNNHTIDRPGYQKEGAVAIGDHVWIGERSMILAGVTIGEGTVIAAGSIVTKDVPAHVMSAGIPAKVIREQINWY